MSNRVFAQASTSKCSGKPWCGSICSGSEKDRSPPGAPCPSQTPSVSRRVLKPSPIAEVAVARCSPMFFVIRVATH